MIQPIDIKTQSFKKGLFGYKAADVDAFIDAVYKAYDELFRENKNLSDSLDKLNTSLQENRLKMFEMENELQKAENVSSYGDDEAAKKKADEIIKNAEKAAAEIIAKAKAESGKIEAEEPKKESVKFSVSDSKSPEERKAEAEKKADEVKENSSSRFFKKNDDDAPKAAADEDDDEIFVGEIEDARKPDRMMIGDGEEEEDMDFEFL